MCVCVVVVVQTAMYLTSYSDGLTSFVNHFNHVINITMVRKMSSIMSVVFTFLF